MVRIIRFQVERLSCLLKSSAQPLSPLSHSHLLSWLDFLNFISFALSFSYLQGGKLLLFSFLLPRMPHQRRRKWVQYLTAWNIFSPSYFRMFSLIAWCSMSLCPSVHVPMTLDTMIYIVTSPFANCVDYIYKHDLWPFLILDMKFCSTLKYVKPNLEIWFRSRLFLFRFFSYYYY